MRRAELVTCAAVLALASCMKIYPDPELPDVDVEWSEPDCSDGAVNVALALIGVDDPTLREERTIPCADLKARFADVSRERHRIEATLLDAQGAELDMAEYEVDLRDGLDETAYLYFGDFDNYRVLWMFDMGASCAALAVDEVVIEFSSQQQPGFSRSGPCEFGMQFGSAPEGVFAVRAIALSDGSPVAASPKTPELAFVPGMFTLIGTLVLSPCSADCLR